MDQLRKVSRPTCLEYYHAANDMCNFSTRDVFLLIIYCIYERKNGQQDLDFISDMIDNLKKKKDTTLPKKKKSKDITLPKEEIYKDIILTNQEIKNLKKYKNATIHQEVNLQFCDVLLLKKIILYILCNYETKYKEKKNQYSNPQVYSGNQAKEDFCKRVLDLLTSYESEINVMKKTIRDLSENKNKFSHAEESLVLNDKYIFNKMKDDFINLSKKLIDSSCEIAAKDKIEINKHFDKLVLDLNNNWPSNPQIQGTTWQETQPGINEDNLNVDSILNDKITEASRNLDASNIVGPCQGNQSEINKEETASNEDGSIINPSSNLNVDVTSSASHIDGKLSEASKNLVEPSSCVDNIAQKAMSLMKNIE